MKLWAIPLALMVTILLVTVASAEIIFTDLAPPDGFSAENGTLIELNSIVTDNITYFVNGTICVTYDRDAGKGLCGGSCSSGGEIGLDILNVPVNFGTTYWNANFTNCSDSAFFESEIRSYIGVFSDRTLVPIYPINNETVIGDSTNFIVNYTVDVYVPSDITYQMYVRFYAYSSYLSSPLYSSENLICTVLVNGTDKSPIRRGLHRYGCENYMYDTYYINYEELPNYKYWRAKLRILDGEVDGANLLSDTGYQDYTYQVNTNLAHIYPPDEAVYCDETLYLWNATWYNLAVPCNDRAWSDEFIDFFSYLRDDGCGGGNLTWNYKNNANYSQSGVIQHLLVPNSTEDYFQSSIVLNSENPSNETYTGYTTNLTAVHLIHNWTYDCTNGTTYTTPNSDLWYIIGIGQGGNITENVTVGYVTYPICEINYTAIMPSFADDWGYFFGQNIAIGLALLALFFVSVMSILVTIRTDAVSGGSVGIFGVLVFARICYLPIEIAYLMLLTAGLVVVYLVRRLILNRSR